MKLALIALTMTTTMAPAALAQDDAAAVSGEATAADADVTAAPDAAVPPDVEPSPDTGEGAAAAGEERARPVFLVTEVVVEPGVGIGADAARDALAARFGKLKQKLDVRSLGEVKATINQQSLNQLLGAEEGADLEKLGQYVDADRIVFGRIHKVGNAVEVAVRVVNAREASVEAALSRRVKAGADESLLLAVVDALADRLAVWALSTYGDASPSAEFERLKQKKVAKQGGAEQAVDEEGAEATPWSFLGVGGSAIAGLGLGAVGVGATLIATDPARQPLIPSIVMGAGALTFAGGMAMVVVDGIE